MECQVCQKRPATLHFTQVINGNKTEVHVCDICAKEKGYVSFPEDGYSLHNLLKGLFSIDGHAMDENRKKQLHFQREYQCPQCELTFSEFQRTGKFGCAKCYETFSPRIDAILRRVHSGNTEHHGKIPKRRGGDLHIKRQIEEYREQLLKLVEEEAFEEAAKVRDKINALKEQTNSSSRGDDR
ncbi:MAG TPA: UvrB/UvrC motif-containing protein [Bacillota bacterium]|nr:UvrB/UvrC motif-containing protein [Bacillota bacterium]